MIERAGLEEIRGDLIFVQGAAAFDEIVSVQTENSERLGRVIYAGEDFSTVLVFGGTRGLALDETSVRFSGKPLTMRLSPEISGRVFDGLARPRDGLGEVFGIPREIGGTAMNPVRRVYPREAINTGFSATDALHTLVRGQKLPIFSSDGLPHDRLAAAIATQAGCDAVIFAAMGIQHDTAEFFRRTFIESGQFERTTFFLNMADDPPAERVATPRFALTAAEYLAFDLGLHVLVILTDMTSYAEALREISSSRGEIPGRKGFPGYMYSDFASIYERAGIRQGCGGSVTQIPILTMPADDITHPIPDLTGYITEGQIVLCRELHQKGIFPPINVLPSLSRLMKDTIDNAHADLAAKLFARCAAASEVRALAAVISEEDLSETDKKILKFASEFEEQFLKQDDFESRTIDETLKLAEKLLGTFEAPP
ncbi:MAG: V-type ATP synthase subunit B [Defluviitaleaceae bacterium]|nr:V-type ATP synthase subunit B [Defluviitaleaceae bacterium]